MLLSVEKRFLFVANTKTASTSLEVALEPHAEVIRAGTPERKHTPLARLLEVYDFVFKREDLSPDTFFKFGVMRDPVDWLQSWYRYRRGNNVDAPLPEEMTLSDFWAQKDWNIQRADGTKNLQRTMFCDAQDRVLADVIIPYPQLGSMTAEIFAALGIEAPLDHHNVSRIAPSADIDPVLEAEMRAFYAEDYALYDRLDKINAIGMDRLRTRAITAA